jgi:large subunit ribosomal protein L24
MFRVNRPRHAQAKFHIKKNDEVVVLSGTQQGKRGKVLEVLRNRSRVIIEGVNLIKKSQRKSQHQPEGGIIEREGALHISKIMLAADYDNRKSATSENAKTAAAAAAAETEAKPAKKTASRKK